MAEASLRAGDVVLVDEAGMLDQDTARALLTIADENSARVALVGDRRQLPAVGRGGVLDVAHRWARPDARVDLTGVHRFMRDVDGELVPDAEYAALTIALREGDEPGAVFDALHARVQIVIHASEIERHDALAAHVAEQRCAGGRPAVVVDTREQADALSTAIRERLVAAGVVDDRRVVTTGDGQRLGAGDVVVTRRNDSDLGVANREAWTVVRVRRDGRLTVLDPERGRRELTAEYVRLFVELGYASTGYGVQGDTTGEAHVLVTDKTTAANLYVGLTRGRHANLAHLVAESVEDAREQWISAAARDRADLGAEHAAARVAREAAGYTPARPLDQVLADLRTTWGERADQQRELQEARSLRDRLAEVIAARAERDRALAPLRARYEQARGEAEHAKATAQQSAAEIERQTEQVRERLFAAWDAQRDHAGEAARLVRAGPGRLGLHLARCNRATEDLARWSLAWQPYLSAMPVDTAGIARFADRYDDRPRLYDAFDRYARAQAERAHPDHGDLQQAAEHAAERQGEAWRELSKGRYHYDNEMVRYGSLGYRDDDLAPSLAELDQEIAAGEHRLAGLDRRLDRLGQEPAIAAQPEGWLTGQHQQWRTDRAAEAVARIAQELADTRAALEAEARRHDAHQHEAYEHQYGHDYGHDAGRDGPSFGI